MYIYAYFFSLEPHSTGSSFVLDAPRRTTHYILPSQGLKKWQQCFSYNAKVLPLKKPRSRRSCPSSWLVFVSVSLVTSCYLSRFPLDFQLFLCHVLMLFLSGLRLLLVPLDVCVLLQVWLHGCCRYAYPPLLFLMYSV